MTENVGVYTEILSVYLSKMHKLYSSNLTAAPTREQTILSRLQGVYKGGR